MCTYIYISITKIVLHKTPQKNIPRNYKGGLSPVLFEAQRNGLNKRRLPSPRGIQIISSPWVSIRNLVNLDDLG